MLALLAAAAACDERPRTYSTAENARIVVYEDDFERADLGDNWRVTGRGFELVGGELRVENARNHPAWLQVPLPENFAIDFDAWAATEEGDIKVEFAGDGESSATSVSYVASGYVAIFGGWSNRLSAIARRDEHGTDRKTRSEPVVEVDRRYHFQITRRDGEIRWQIDGDDFLEFVDEAPLRGPRQAYFAFSGWEAETHFDNLRIVALPEQP